MSRIMVCMFGLWRVTVGRDLRMAKLRLKISGGFRSEQGASNFAILRAVIATAGSRGRNILDTLAHPGPMQLIPRLRF